MSEVEQFLKNFSRMCDSYGSSCRYCALGLKPAMCNRYPVDWDRKTIQESIDAVIAWTEQHPEKKRIDDLLEKYPGFDLRDGYPMFYPRVFGYCDKECRCCDGYERGLAYCWNQPL